MNSRASRTQKACFMLRRSRGCIKKWSFFMKAMTKQQLADCARVSVRTLMNWCRPYRKELAGWA